MIINMLLRMVMAFILITSFKAQLYGGQMLKDITYKKSIKMADYTRLIPIIKRWEGGWSNHPLDKGGCTNSGVTISTYRFHFGKNKTCEDLKKMTEDEWNYIFKTGYWDKWKADEINSQAIANICVDFLWASGVYGIKYIQRILGVAADGIVGPKTLAAINGYKTQKELFYKIWNRRKTHFEAIVKKNPSQQVFLRGWMNRLNAFKWFE